jgi:hypothetical protein
LKLREKGAEVYSVSAKLNPLTTGLGSLFDAGAASASEGGWGSIAWWLLKALVEGQLSPPLPSESKGWGLDMEKRTSWESFQGPNSSDIYLMRRPIGDPYIRDDSSM